MLSDTTIKRDTVEPLIYRYLLMARKKLTAGKRKNLNTEIREKLKDAGSYTIFSNNCLGGVLYHDAGARFMSPTINTAMDGKDFIKFCENPGKYFNVPMNFITFPGHNYPIAEIDDIQVRFVHYKTADECVEKWNERAKRIVWDNIFIIATNHDGMNSDECMKNFDNLPYQNKVMFVTKDYPEYPWVIKVPQFENRFQVRVITNIANLRGERYYETCFDIPLWIKSAGNPFNVSNDKQ